MTNDSQISRSLSGDTYGPDHDKQCERFPKIMSSTRDTECGKLHPCSKRQNCRRVGCPPRDNTATTSRAQSVTPYEARQFRDQSCVLRLSISSDDALLAYFWLLIFIQAVIEALTAQGVTRQRKISSHCEKQQTCRMTTLVLKCRRCSENNGEIYSYG